MAATAPLAALSKGVYGVTWTFITGVTGVSNSINAPDLPDKVVQVHATTWGTGNVLIEGNNAELPSLGVFTTLVDVQGNSLSFSDNAIEQILENPRYIRARASTVTTGATITVSMICRG